MLSRIEPPWGLAEDVIKGLSRVAGYPRNNYVHRSESKCDLRFNIIHIVEYVKPGKSRVSSSLDPPLVPLSYRTLVQGFPIPPNDETRKYGGPCRTNEASLFSERRKTGSTRGLCWQLPKS